MTQGFGFVFLVLLFVWLAGRPLVRAAVPVQVPGWVVELSRELHPFMPYVFVVGMGAVAWGQGWQARVMDSVLVALLLAGWWMHRGDDDDDRWKRRRRRAADAVRAAGRRLVVVPAGT